MPWRGGTHLSAVGFLRVVIMPMFSPSCMFLSLLPPETSSGVGQGQPRQGWSLLLPHRHHRPGFRPEAAHGQWCLVEPRYQEPVPASAKDTHPPQAGGPSRPRLPGDQGRDGQDRAGRDRLVRLAPHAQQPPGRHRDGQPPARRPLGLGHVGALPLPTGAFGDLEALLNPGPQAIPGGRTGLGRQVRQDQPWRLIPRLPTGQQGPGHLPVAAVEGEARPLPRRARLGDQRLQGHLTPLPLGPKGAAGVDAQKRVPSQARDAPKQPARVPAAIRQDAHGPGAGERPVHLAQPAPPLPAPGMFGCRCQDRPGHRPGTAPLDHAERQHGKAGAQRRRIEGQGQWCALPLADAPGQQRHKAGLHGQGAARRPAFGGSLIAQLAPLLADGGLFAAQPRRQERADGGQRPGASPHHAQAPQGQDRSLRLGQMGQVGLDDCRPFGHTGMARHRYPPWGDGRDATSHTMPHRGGSCHLLDDVVPSFFKNLLQKGTHPSQAAHADWST
jgi:hypothetical protein